MTILKVSEAAFVAENCCIFFDKMCDIFQFIGEFWFVKNVDFNSCSFLKRLSQASFLRPTGEFGFVKTPILIVNCG